MTADWQAAGLCLIPAYMPHFNDRRPPRTTRRDHENAAKDVCKRCPVIGACLQDALKREGGKTAAFRDGVRGALTARERAALAGADTTGDEEDP
jgi:hypothetical protein